MEHKKDAKSLNHLFESVPLWTQSLKLEPYFEHYLVTLKCPRGGNCSVINIIYLKLEISKLGKLFKNMTNAWFYLTSVTCWRQQKHALLTWTHKAWNMNHNWQNVPLWACWCLIEIYKYLPNVALKHPPSSGLTIVIFEAQNFRNSNLET
jgi:hypothetical protein